ncbi:hypothetical protein THIOM_005490 [Candidatus Thiomargarita nelsonii]|uniref:HTH cro/C1-type domain-containing protein n=1 Tax=Candidatus Thiomargarita nelsonii TaxID=1003181 RepID=A0A176RT00_9GAMM|nr:hypothetical protein THIOM_005490 [Candidatus Thiomargarita nelsonii]
MTTTSFGELLLKYMDRANARVDKLAEAAEVSRQTVISWKKDSFNPRNRGKVLACAKFLKLTEEETNLLLVAAGFAEEYVLNELAGNMLLDETDLFIQSEIKKRLSNLKTFS